MINSELLKEAIADAKAVRATALANAKASLEEAFAPRFEAMFAEKLKEESEEQEEMVSEVEAPNQIHGKGGEAKGPATKPVSKGEPHKGSAAKKDFKTIAVGGSEGAAGSKAPAAKQSIVTETETEEEGKKMDENNLTSEDLDEIIKELEAEVSGEEDVPPAPAPAPEGDPAAELPVAPAPEGDPAAAMPPAPVAPPVCDPAACPPAPVAPAPEGDPAAAMPPAPAPAPDGEEEINLEELLASLNEEAEEEEEGKVDEGKLPPWLKKKGEKGEKEDDKEDDKEEVDEALKNDGVPTNELKGQDKSGGVKGYPAASQDASKKQLQGKNHNISGKGNIGTGAVGGLSEVAKYKVALKESYDAIRFLRGQINEVNLLNAKLLYTNKLFKEFAGVLDDTYRMKIVESFDLTKSVREVKLAYALLAESLNFGTKMHSKPAATKPSPSQKTVRITEGLASKPVASTKPSAEIITEASQMADRFKKLAGIKDAPKK